MAPDRVRSSDGLAVKTSRLRRRDCSSGVLRRPRGIPSQHHRKDVRRCYVDSCSCSQLSFSFRSARAEDKGITIINQREAFPIWFVYITPAGAPDWGNDQRGDTVINAGQSRSWTIPFDGCYVDVKAVSFTGLSTERRSANVCGGMTWTIEDANPKD